MKTDKPYNDFIVLPPQREKVETLPILRQLVISSVALAELKGLANVLPDPNILLNAVILRDASASSEIENVITTQDKLLIKIFNYCIISWERWQILR
ncbi:Fic/DOC family N-terminal domain-containing protein [Chitinophaga sp. S165]|uniref:Fic/DOC family N-terminal domain-containing protein n=1 Tax=Chitinophaga sp. S165 TaxID=2135462 RepID=UPI000D709246|nr:Fic/DOC family N-terminal domain-containing protein [Chitinophaga sp. S165]PWV47691.1 Fic/DOC family protein [Chitinophaga sp. S165]